MANGQQVASKTVSASDNWQYSFDNLAAYANGKKITYTVTENAVAGYTSTVDGYNITNTHNPTTPKKPQVPNNPTTPKEPQVPNNGNKVTPKAYTQGKTYEKTGKLPQTGNESSMGMMLIGLVTLLLSLGLVVISRFTIWSWLNDRKHSTTNRVESLTIDGISDSWVQTKIAGDQRSFLR